MLAKKHFIWTDIIFNLNKFNFQHRTIPGNIRRRAERAVWTLRCVGRPRSQISIWINQHLTVSRNNARHRSSSWFGKLSGQAFSQAQLFASRYDEWPSQIHIWLYLTNTLLEPEKGSLQKQTHANWECKHFAQLLASSLDEWALPRLSSIWTPKDLSFWDFRIWQRRCLSDLILGKICIGRKEEERNIARICTYIVHPDH